MSEEEKRPMSASEKKKEDWMNSKWRPMMGWMYMLVCTMDFIVFPILWSIHQSVSQGNVASQWTPLTLQGAGLFHMAMGAIIGVAAFGRTQEKLAGASNSFNNQPTSFGASNSFNNQPTSFGASNSFNNQPTSFRAAPATSVALSSSGKKMPMPAEDPPL